MQPILNVENLKTWFPVQRGIFSRTSGYVRAVDGVSFSINKGETLGLVGESGCGKTTVARSIMQLETPTGGSIHFHGKNLLSLAGKDMKSIRKSLQIVFQDPFSSLNPRMNVMDLVTEGMIEHKLIRASEREEAAEKLLHDVGLGKHALYRYPHEFSGGQRQRICIARALSLRPELIVCDEAVSALDVSIQAQVINLLMDLRDAYHLAFLFISHDLSVVRHISDRVAVMYLGRIVEEGPAEEVITSPQHPYTQALISAVPRIDGTKSRRVVLQGDVPSPAHPPSGCRFHPRCPVAMDVCKEKEPELAGLLTNENHLTACFKKPSVVSTER